MMVNDMKQRLIIILVIGLIVIAGGAAFFYRSYRQSRAVSFPSTARSGITVSQPNIPPPQFEEDPPNTSQDAPAPSGQPLLDSDNDGLPDVIEKDFGTNPANPDTDGDGFKDGDEVRNGYNPRGPGKL